MPRPACTRTLLFLISLVAGVTGEHHNIRPLVGLFAQADLELQVLQSSASQVARITGLRHGPAFSLILSLTIPPFQLKSTKNNTWFSRSKDRCYHCPLCLTMQNSDQGWGASCAKTCASSRVQKHPQTLMTPWILTYYEIFFLNVQKHCWLGTWWNSKSPTKKT
jgi:hypothetical protein